MELKHEALSRDGYIIDQRKTENIPFGFFPSSKNGCGWIAAYNFLKAVDQDPDPEKTLKWLEKTLPLGGFLGVNLFALAYYIRRQGVPLNVAVRPFHAQELSETCRGGIVFYRAGRTNHFAAFRREENGTLRFFGAMAGAENHQMSMAEFYWKYVKFPISVVITAK